MCEKYEQFFKDCLEFKQKVENLKKAGQNDYNPYLALMSENEENAHSNILFSFLDTKSKHYQGDLFLKCFLESTKLKEWFGDTKNAKIEREKSLSGGRIDLYISNSEKCIIIENKIYAKDQDKQIQRYIKGIYKDCFKEYEKKYEYICVVYLTLWGCKPSKYSLGEWKIDKSDEHNPKLKKQDAKGTHLIEYQQLSYKKDILDWLNNVQKELKDITNLNQALEAYKDVVKIMTNQKEDKMSIADFLNGKGDEDYQIALDIIKERDKIIANYLEKICKELQEQGDLKNWKCCLFPKYENGAVKFIFFPKENKGEYFFAFAWCNYNSFSYSNDFFEVRICGENIADGNKRAEIAEKLRELSFTENKRNTIDSKDEWDKQPPFENNWSCVRERIPNFFNDFDKEKTKNFIKKYKNIVIKINKHLSEHYPSIT